MSAVSTVLMGKAEAEEITNRIQNAGNTLGVLLLEAYEREAWKALGYKSWKVYVEDRFTFNRQHSYALLTQAKVNRVLPDGEEASIREAREVVRQVPASAPAAVKAVLADIRAPLKDKRPKRGIPEKTSLFNGLSQQIENLNERMDGYEDDEIASYLTGDERRAYERAVTKATEFAERGGRILTMEVRRVRDEYESA